MKIHGHDVSLTKPLSFVGAYRYWWDNRRSAWGTIRKLTSLGIYPKTLIDFGAHNSEWSIYLSRHWPSMKVVSFEPNTDCNPIGEVHREGLSNKREDFKLDVSMDIAGFKSPKGTKDIFAYRYDELNLKINYPAILKVDCENMTYEALEGCGKLLESFSAIHSEMTNDELEGQYVNRSQDICKLLYDHGFTKMHVVDCAVWPRNISYFDALFLK
jgi:hypothetical protein